MSTGPEHPQRPVSRSPQDSPATGGTTAPDTSTGGTQAGTSPGGQRAAAPPADPERDRKSPRDIERPDGPGTGPAETGLAPRSGGKTAGLWISLILGTIVLILLLIFIIQNNVPAQFEYFNAQFQLPLGVAMLLAAIAGALIMALVGSVRMFQMSWTIRKLRKQQEKIHRTTR